MLRDESEAVVLLPTGPLWSWRVELRGWEGWGGGAYRQLEELVGAERSWLEVWLEPSGQ